ncbi:hypothetical protein PFICI_11751 [Pestalotiopsis fici W106-1]|uniref:Uncharacterized protein n=1 Tax=Pestalotiopsis fici (strain W106-1 / CGMCC3.15140) TaxID=1229662 RepID=W3WR98_PESFW|nr:uncharacterized protein PFICI_11751 [Pestalotiopsis fici W106-1]ETS76364.1 hypothetical protein PFICI_11751 [Pestalotiopsis fici W106-1]
MSPECTYLLASAPSNLTYTPSGPIQLGNIIANPLEPAKVLSSIDDKVGRAYNNNLEKDFQFSQGGGLKFQGGFWAKVLQAFGLSFDAINDKHEAVSYSVKKLETRTLKSIPREEELRKRFSELAVRRHLNSGHRTPKLYLICGLKVAYGMTVCTDRAHDRGGGVQAEVPIPADGIGLAASVGAGIQLNRQRQRVMRFEAEGPVVLAYELLVIRVRKRRDQGIDIDSYKPRGAFLHGDDDDGSEDDVLSEQDSGYSGDDTEIETSTVERADLDKWAKGFWITNEDGQETIVDRT